MSNEDKVKELTEAIEKVIAEIDQWGMYPDCACLDVLSIRADLAKAIEPPFVPKYGQIVVGRVKQRSPWEPVRFIRMQGDRYQCSRYMTGGEVYTFIEVRPLTKAEIEGES